MGNKRLLKILKNIQNDPNYINTLNSQELESVYDILSNDKSKHTNESSTNSESKGIILTKSTPYYKGEDTRTNNTFIKKDGFGVAIVFTLIILICTLVFMFIIFK